MNGTTKKSLDNESIVDEKVLGYSEKILSLLLELSVFADNVERIINNPAELRLRSRGYLFLNSLKQKMLKLDSKSLLEGLKEVLEIIEFYDKKLADFIRNYEARSIKEIDYLRSLLFLLRPENLRMFILRSEVVLAGLSNINDVEFRRKLKVRLLLLRLYIEENDEIGRILHDLEDGRMLHKDVLFTTERLQKYFDGERCEDGTEFKGLESKFRDSQLKSRIFENKSIKRLLYLSQFLHKEEEQIMFVSGLVSQLKEAEKSGTWKGFLREGGFFEGIKDYADKFIEFKNERYAKIFLRGKKSFGEQPDVWLKLVRNMLNHLNKLRKEKNDLLVNIGNLLHEEFSARHSALDTSIPRVAADTNTSVANYLRLHEDMVLFRELKDAMIRIEKTMDSKWRKSKREFTKLRSRTNSKYIEIVERSEELAEQNDISREATALYKYLESISAFVRHKDQTLNLMQRRFDISHFLILDFDLARLIDVHEGIGQIQKALERKTSKKDTNLIIYLRRIVLEFVRIYREFIDFIKNLDIGISTEIVESRINQFLASEYGGDLSGRATARG